MTSDAVGLEADDLLSSPSSEPSLLELQRHPDRGLTDASRALRPDGALEQHDSRPAVAP
ncbi:MAG: hypothetical protein HYR85_02760 [Planctomycetes bacterium]|nr:hypothetical protein [Planctomycetota bacterium]